MKEAFTAIKARQSLLLRVTGTIVAIVLMVYLLVEQGWGEIEAAIRQIETWRLGVALLLMIISRLAVTGRWYVLLQSGGIQITPSESFKITLAGLFANNFLPTTVGGDVIRLAGTLRLKYDAAVSAASLIADRLVGMAGMLMVVPVGLPKLMQIHNIRDLIPSGTSAVEISVAALPFGKFFSRVWGRSMGLLQRLVATLSLWLRKPRSLFYSLLFTWLHQLCLYSILTLSLWGMGEHISFWLVAGLYSFVYLITLIPISINGYGLQEISMTLVFSRLGGVSLASSLTAALLFRTIMMIASLPGVLFVPGLISYSRQTPEVNTPPVAE